MPILSIPASDNPFGVDIWDCRAFAQGMISTTGNPQAALMFHTLRSSTGIDHQGKVPERAQSCTCELEYEFRGELDDGPLFKAAEMEDKWDIYLYRPFIYFARSWSGQLDYRATVVLEPGRLIITQVEYPEPEDAEFATRVVDYLIKSHVFDALVPHPLPSDLPCTPRQIAVASFSLFGRKCAFGSYADTTGLHGIDSAL